MSSSQEKSKILSVALAEKKLLAVGPKLAYNLFLVIHSVKIVFYSHSSKNFFHGPLREMSNFAEKLKGKTDVEF